MPVPSPILALSVLPFSWEERKEGTKEVKKQEGRKEARKKGFSSYSSVS